MLARFSVFFGFNAMHRNAMRLRRRLALLATTHIMFLAVGAHCSAKGPVLTSVCQAGPLFYIQGEYVGVLGPSNDSLQVGIHVIALGQDRFRAVLYRGGLPGDGWNKGGTIEAEAVLENGRILFQQGDFRAVWSDGKIEVRLEARGGDDPMHDGTIERVSRTSPTMGQPVPANGIALFDGSSVDAWTGENNQAAQMTDGLLHPGVMSRARFTDHRLHIEFRTPLQPEDTAQSRGNSGVYVDGRYEIQILDSFGLSGEQNECGGVVNMARPAENMCFPPLQWQTYDVDFIAPKYDHNGKLTSHASMTVRHNGVLIHDHVALPRANAGNPLPAGPEPGYVYLQEHGNPVRFRNIWAAPLQEGDAFSSAAPSPERWAHPYELRGKKMIGTGQCSLQPGLAGVTPEFLRANPAFCQTHPFDGVVLMAPIDAAWTQVQGLGEGPTMLDEVCWSPRAVPYTALGKTLDDIRHIVWGPLTDNFLWYRMTGEGREGPAAVDLSNDKHWSAVEHNAAMTARLCRQAGLKGFMLDTEQYGVYERLPPNAQLDDEGKPKKAAFPLGLDSPEVLRMRGRQWIQAVQAEYPDITILIYFAWSPDLKTADFLAGVNDFLDGVLEGIEGSARLVHCYENTFYYGHAPQSRYTEEGFPGGRSKYQWARSAMQLWRSYSADPRKYDKYLETGMAAWVESDPYDLWNNYGSATKETIWSNLPLALAYADEYVWVWSEHTHYGHAFQRGTGPNPFLLSLSNQTQNTGVEAARALDEDFAHDPLLRGWYFDFDMLEIGRRQDPAQTTANFTLDAVPYAWSPANKTLRVQGKWMTGPRGDQVADFGQQRRRYVHALEPLRPWEQFKAAIDFSVEAFGSTNEPLPSNESSPTNEPMVMGLFAADASVDRQGISLQIYSPTDVRIVCGGDEKVWTHRLALHAPLQAGRDYKIALEYDGSASHFSATLTDVADATSVAVASERLSPDLGDFGLDEVGAAQWDGVRNPEVRDAKSMPSAYVLNIRRAAVSRADVATEKSMEKDR